MLLNTLMRNTEARDQNPNVLDASDKHIRIHCQLTAPGNDTPVRFEFNRANNFLNDPSKYEVCIESCIIDFTDGSAFPINFRRLTFRTTMPVISELQKSDRNITKTMIGYYYPSNKSAITQLYEPTEKRWYNMSSDYPLNRFDLELISEFAPSVPPVTDDFPFLLSAGQSVDLVVLFRRKD